MTLAPHRPRHHQVHVDGAGPTSRRAGSGAPRRVVIEPGRMAMDLVRTLAAGSLWTLGFLLILGMAPRVLGWTPLTIRSGSMEPTISRGDILHGGTREPGSPLGQGAIAIFDRPGANEFVSHRIVRVEDDGYVTQGDNNPEVDTWGPVADEDIGLLGRMIVPYAGLPGLWLSEGRFGHLAATVLLVGGAISLVSSAPDAVEVVRHRRAADRQPRPSHRSPAPATRRHGLRPGALRRLRRRPSTLDGTEILTLSVTGTLVLAIGAAVPLAASGAFSSTDSSDANSFAAASAFPTWSASVSGSSPVAWYRLSGDADDETGGDDGTGVAGVGFAGISLVSSDTDASAVFDGVDDAVTLPDTEALGGASGGFTNRSIEAWFRADVVSGRQAIVELGDSTTGMNLYLDGATLRGRAWSSGWSSDLEVSTSVAATTTHHVVVTLDTAGHELALYLDGAAIGSTSTGETTALAPHRSTHAIGIVAGTTDFHDGAGTAGSPFAGRIDEVVVIDATLDATQVSTRYAAGI